MRKPESDMVPITTVSSLYDLYNLKSKELLNEKSETAKLRQSETELESKIDRIETEKKELYEKHVELSTKTKNLESKNAETENLIMSASLQLVPAFKSILQMVKISQELSGQSNTDDLSKLKSELQEIVGDSFECKICLESREQKVVFNCGHYVCLDCSGEVFDYI